MKPYPKSFKEIEAEIDEELTSLFGAVEKEIIHVKSLDGGYTIEWYLHNIKVAFFTAVWDKKYQQWEGSFRVFNVFKGGTT